jgi:isoquinoline 1-oxidoreductase beta subunit
VISRRTLLLGSAAVAGGVAIGYRHARLPDANPLTAELGAGQTALTPYVIIDQSGVTIITPRAEMGQGIHTTLAALVAEELDIALTDVHVEHGPASETYSNDVAFKPQASRGRLDDLRQVIWPARSTRATHFTGGQSSIQDAYVKMRKAGAAARAALLMAAAKTLRVPPGSLVTDNGAVVDPNGRRIPYADLAAAAAKVELLQEPTLKPRAEWKLLGKSQPRVDMVDKCAGSAEFAIDVKHPDMLFATARLNPHLGSVMRSFDASKAETRRGVRKIVAIEQGVIVIATNTWYAFEAAKALEFDWGDAPYPHSTAGHREAVERAMDYEYHSRPRDEGDVDAVLADSELIEGEYRAPYLAHATMEPLSAVALFKEGRLDIWAGNQRPTKAVLISAAIARIDPARVKVHTTYMGGGFGRRLETDFVSTAVHAAMACAGTPVKVTWSREEDMTHGVYRPMAMARFRAAVSGHKPLALDLKVSSPSLVSSADVRYAGSSEDRPDKFTVTGARDQPYQIEHYRVTAYRPPNLLPVGWWRSVGESQNSFFHESIMDELAHAARVDPLTMRLAALKHAPSRKVLERVAEMSNWGSGLPVGHAMGVAYVLSSGAATAQVMEVRSTNAGIEILNAYVAVDVGIALDPRNIEAQIEGSLIFGLAAATKGEITVTNGRVDQTNFHDYPLPRMGQLPAITVSIVESGQRIFGVGESATASTAPALGNAIFAATGRRLRELPFAKSVRFL